jgi:hypothetical protein
MEPLGKEILRVRTGTSPLRERLAGGGIFDHDVFQYAGRGIADSPGQGSREMWGQWRLGIVRLTTMSTAQWDKADRDPSWSQGKTTLAIAPPAWPEFSLSYGRHALSSAFEPSSVAAPRSVTDSVEATLAYSRTAWDARLSTIYSMQHDLLWKSGESVGVTYAIHATYRAADHVTIAPSLSFKDDQQRWSGVRLSIPSASLMVSYTPFRTLNIRASGSFSKTRSSDGLIDSHSSNVSSGLVWLWSETSRLRTTLLFDASYTASQNLVQFSRPVEDIAGLLRLQFSRL